jgi:L-threonylcarbamoyladenylate synthase
VKVLRQVDIKSNLGLRTQAFAALELLREGRIICAALENGYVLIVDPTSKAGVDRLKSIKLISEDIYFPLLVSGVDSLIDLSPNITPALRLVAKEFWPGPLNIEIQARNSLPWTFGGQSAPNTLIVRAPSSRFLMELLLLITPLIFTPAASIGAKSPIVFKEIEMNLHGEIELLLNSGPCSDTGFATTVSFLGSSEKVTREGLISFYDLKRVLPSIKQS